MGSSQAICIYDKINHITDTDRKGKIMMSYPTDLKSDAISGSNNEIEVPLQKRKSIVSIGIIILFVILAVSLLAMVVLEITAVDIAVHLDVKMIFSETKRPLPDEKELAAFIGPPMYDSLRRCGFEHEEAEKGVEIYKRHFVEHGIYKNRVYDGMTEVLSALGLAPKKPSPRPRRAKSDARAVPLGA